MNLVGADLQIRIYSTLIGPTKRNESTNTVLHMRFDDSGYLLFSEVKEASHDMQLLNSEIDNYMQQVQFKLHYPDYVYNNYTKSLVGDSLVIGEKYLADDPLIINCLKADHGIERDDILKELLDCIQDLICVMKENEVIINSVRDEVVVLGDIDHL